MAKQIATVVDAQGATLELREIASVVFERDLNVLQVNTRDCIVRHDGKTVVINEGTGFHFDQENLENTHGFTAEEVQEVLDLKDQYLTDLITLLEKKAKVEGEE